jgi:predicted NAD-dependent protein-ADP-ribosyltransferase YbiA (DUF1768 family)
MAEKEGADVAAGAPADAPEPMPPAEGAPPRLEVPPLDQTVPYSKETQKAIRDFYKKRRKEPAKYTYTFNGNLEIASGEKAAGTINLQQFIPLEPQEREALEQLRLDAIAEIETKLEEAIDTLRDAWETYRRTGAMAPVLQGNQAVNELESRRTALRSAVRSTVAIGNVETRKVLFDQPYEGRKMLPQQDPFGGELYRTVYRDFPAERFYGKYVPDEDAPAAAAAAEDAAPVPQETATRQKLKDGRMARIFFEKEDSGENGFLSPAYAIDFVFEETRYAMPLQAYEAERARELKEDSLRTALLKVRASRMIRTLTKKPMDHPVDAKGLWLRIYTAVYQQHPELQKKLLDTGADALVYADPRAGPSGIGLSLKDRGTLDQAQWKGENAVGLAQETVRTRLREATLEEAPEGEVREAVITEEQQAANRVGAIINAKRNAAAVAGRPA